MRTCGVDAFELNGIQQETATFSATVDCVTHRTPSQFCTVKAVGIPSVTDAEPTPPRETGDRAVTVSVSGYCSAVSLFQSVARSPSIAFSAT